MARPSHLCWSAQAAREWFVARWQQLRPTIVVREAAVPRIWSTWGNCHGTDTSRESQAADLCRRVAGGASQRAAGVMTPNSFLSLGPEGFHRIAYGAWGSTESRHAVLCVHGLSRNSRDFDRLAAALIARVTTPVRHGLFGQLQARRRSANRHKASDHATLRPVLISPNHPHITRRASCPTDPSVSS
jgi:hypothetical protein